MIETLQDLTVSMPDIEYLALNLVLGIVILAVGWSASIFVGRAVRNVAARSSRVDPTIVPMVHSVTVWAIRIFVVVAVLARLGVQTASVIAVLGAAGLAIGLALQGTLQNIAAGIMLLALRPLRAGESISVVGKADGTVDEVGLFLSRLKQADGTFITLPNSLIWGNAIINFSRNATRRLDFQVAVRYGDNLELAMSELRKLIETHELALKDPKPEVMVTEYRDSQVIVTVRAWAESARHWDLRCALHRRALEALADAGLRPPIPLTEVQAKALPESP